MINLTGKIFLITGAGSGIGKALAQALDKLGVTLILNDINESSLADVASTLSQPPLCLPFSVAAKSEWLDAKTKIDAHFKATHYSGIDGIINNAGIAHDSIAFEDFKDTDYEKVMNINFYGVLFGTQVFLPELKTKNEAWVVNISSIFGVTSIGKLSAYCASKFAVKGLTESLKMEAQERFPHVTICVVHPGGVNTEIANNAIHLDDRATSEREQELKTFNKQLTMVPAKAAGIIVSGIQKKKSRILIGPDAKMMDWLARIFPTKYTKILLNQMKKRGLLDD